jgi:hypothetical protein
MPDLMFLYKQIKSEPAVAEASADMHQEHAPRTGGPFFHTFI